MNPREGEETVDLETLSGALAEVDADELGRTRETLVRARDALAGIRTVCMQEAGYDKAPPLERLPQALDAAVAMVETVTGGASAEAGAEQDAPADAVGGSAEAGSGTVAVRLPAGAVANREEAVEAMHVAERYFALKEPSSPVPVLLREAQAASGKSFYELVNELLPDNAAAAAVSLGRDLWFDIHLSTLDARNPAPDYRAEESGPAAAENAGLDEVIGDEEIGGEIGGGVADMAENGSAEDSGAGDAGPDAATPGEASAAAEPQPGAAPAAMPAQDVVPRPAPAGPRFVATSRPEAVALLERVLAYYRVAEPTSPVPLFVERAIELSSNSFIELLGKVMPEGALKAKEG